MNSEFCKEGETFLCLHCEEPIAIANRTIYYNEIMKVDDWTFVGTLEGTILNSNSLVPLCPSCNRHWWSNPRWRIQNENTTD